jgi:hypothetical protein
VTKEGGGGPSNETAKTKTSYAKNEASYAKTEISSAKTEISCHSLHGTIKFLSAEMLQELSINLNFCSLSSAMVTSAVSIQEDTKHYYNF